MLPLSLLRAAQNQPMVGSTKKKLHSRLTPWPAGIARCVCVRVCVCGIARAHAVIGSCTSAVFRLLHNDFSFRNSERRRFALMRDRTGVRVASVRSDACDGPCLYLEAGSGGGCERRRSIIILFLLPSLLPTLRSPA